MNGLTSSQPAEAVSGLSEAGFDGTVRITEIRLRAFAEDLLEAAGVTAGDASVIADALVWADVRGRTPQGVERLPSWLDRFDHRLLRSPAVLSFEPMAPAAWTLDAGDAFGPVSGRAGMERAIETARRQGVGLVAVRQSSHYGAASYYCDLATRAGCLGLTGTNATAKVAAWGGTRPVLGTNPIAFGCPTGSGAPLLVDLSTAALAGSAVRDHLRRGERLPEGAALDSRGLPTTDPADVESGCLLPAGGPKGFALALMVEVLSALLAGAASGTQVGSLFDTTRATGTGHFFLAIDIEAFAPAFAFTARVDRLLGSVKATGAGIRYPGENRERAAAAGDVFLPRETARALAERASRLGVASPWSF